MRYCIFIAILLGFLACGAAGKTRQGPSKQDLKLAEKSFHHGEEFQKNGQMEEALHEFSKASSLAPGNREYLAAREMLRSRMISTYINRGDLLAEIGGAQAAEAEFKKALAIDPENSYAQERLRNLSPDASEQEPVLQLLASVEDVEVNPKPGKANFHVQGDTRQLYDAIGRAFGITVAYDSSLVMKREKFDFDNLDFYTAMRIVGKLTRTFWAPVSKERVIVANDTQEMRRQYERMALQTFYVSNAATPTDLTDVSNVLRNIFDVRLVSVVPEKKVITVRAPKEQMAEIAAILDDAVQGRPEVMLDIKAYELDYDRLRQYGLGLQNTFTIFNVFAAIYSALGSNAQPVIDQLRQTGTIDPTKIPVGALAGIQGSPLLSPFIFFGGGWGLTGISVSPLTGRLSSNVAYSTDLEHLTIRVANGTAANLVIGTRFPISLGSFTNVSISNQGLPQVGSAFPQVQYEDLGLIFKATPHLQAGENVNLELQLQIKGLGAQQFNNVPVITNRDYAGSITVKDGEPSVVAGIIEEQTTQSSAGYPGLGQLPILRGIFNTNSKEKSRTEVLIVVTPHIVRKPFHRLENIIWTTNQ